MGNDGKNMRKRIARKDEEELKKKETSEEQQARKVTDARAYTLLGKHTRNAKLGKQKQGERAKQKQPCHQR